MANGKEKSNGNQPLIEPPKKVTDTMRVAIYKEMFDCPFEPEKEGTTSVVSANQDKIHLSVQNLMDHLPKIWFSDKEIKVDLKEALSFMTCDEDFRRNFMTLLIQTILVALKEGVAQFKGKDLPLEGVTDGDFSQEVQNIKEKMVKKLNDLFFERPDGKRQRLGENQREAKEADGLSLKEEDYKCNLCDLTKDKCDLCGVMLGELTSVFEEKIEALNLAEGELQQTLHNVVQDLVSELMETWQEDGIDEDVLKEVLFFDQEAWQKIAYKFEDVIAQKIIGQYRSKFRENPMLAADYFTKKLKPLLMIQYDVLSESGIFHNDYKITEVDSTQLEQLMMESRLIYDGSFQELSTKILYHNELGYLTEMKKQAEAKFKSFNAGKKVQTFLIDIKEKYLKPGFNKGSTWREWLKKGSLEEKRDFSKEE